jgi:hypothetical protein
VFFLQILNERLPTGKNFDKKKPIRPPLEDRRWACIEDNCFLFLTQRSSSKSAIQVENYLPLII